MDVTVEKMNGFQVIGFERVFETEDAYEKIPKFWEEYRDNYLLPLLIGGKQPENETERTVSECCVGSMPGALQSVNTQIFKEWVPGNPDYEIAMYANVEWYSKGDMNSRDYESGIWLPVKAKGTENP